MSSLAKLAALARTVLVAGLMLALLVAPMASAHAINCTDGAEPAGIAVSALAHDEAAVHGDHHQNGKAGAMQVDRCCAATCADCSAIVAALEQPGALAATGHDRMQDEPAAGIAVAPPHGPPRS